MASRKGRASADEAVTALLEAEVALDHNASFELLSTKGRALFPSADRWARRRSELPRVTEFQPESTERNLVIVLVQHEPGIDPFVGLRFGRERQTWHARDEVGGWFVDPDPDVEPVVPSDSSVKAEAARWVAEVQSCDAAAAASLQAIPTLLHMSAGASALCGMTTALSSSEAALGLPGPQTANLVAQYGTEILEYVRTIRFSGGPATFQVFLVPIGDVWRVVSTSD